MTATREEVWAEALGWLRTPYHPNAAVKGVGADCALMPLAVYVACGVLPPTDIGHYPADWHLHRGEERYIGWLEALGRREIGSKVDGEFRIEGEAPQVGDFGIWKFGRAYSHGAIVGPANQVVHAFLNARMVTLDDMTRLEELRVRPARFFSMMP